MSSEIERQLEHLFDSVGLSTKEIRFNENTGRWIVEPKAEGSDERFHEDIGAIGAGKPVDYTLDFNEVRAVFPKIDGAKITEGIVRIDGTDSSDLLIEIE
ncbi:hypothetical protein EGH22_20475 [Halomicroarcula sp. F28]|uniref:hypothetical protein n=1 Tax=Haloarcula salinisoli TaxID=2487746 RepID=UPI001C72D83F|nr:hypothetical protein [Halomicroarcula salinisoli]MBX0288710.1 hypothetical protein [Halomicroarcula salinisoli]